MLIANSLFYAKVNPIIRAGLFLPCQAALKPAREACESITDNKIDYSNKGKYFCGIDHGSVIDLGGHMGQLRDTDNEGEGGILDEGDELVYKGRDHVSESLWKYDENHDLPRLKP